MIRNLNMEERKLPIGFWVKKADSFLTENIDEIQSSYGLNRTSWQILNTLSEQGEITQEKLESVMSTFANQDKVKSVLEKFEKEGLAVIENEKIKCSEKGLKLHKVCFEKQKIFRDQAMTGISQEEYNTTISTLEKIVNNINNKASATKPKI